ncbi:hypothetical protein [Streptomyces coelicoflavus]|uniref:hypothetical protein n=1 Tax=Streptomyces coelicoflavus TaxID=285562 RepID=UPI0036ACD15F
MTNPLEEVRIRIDQNTAQLLADGDTDSWVFVVSGIRRQAGEISAGRESRPALMISLQTLVDLIQEGTA